MGFDVGKIWEVDEMDCDGVGRGLEVGLVSIVVVGRGIEEGIGTGIDDEEGGREMVGSSWVVVGRAEGSWVDSKGIGVDEVGGGSWLSIYVGESACLECSK